MMKDWDQYRQPWVRSFRELLTLGFLGFALAAVGVRMALDSSLPLIVRLLSPLVGASLSAVVILVMRRLVRGETVPMDLKAKDEE